MGSEDVGALDNSPCVCTWDPGPEAPWASVPVILTHSVQGRPEILGMVSKDQALSDLLNGGRGGRAALEQETEEQLVRGQAQVPGTCIVSAAAAGPGGGGESQPGQE